MSPSAQRIAIAEACGWSQVEDRSNGLMMSPGFLVVGYPPTRAIIGKKEELPDYLNDLNAIHDALLKLFPNEVAVGYYHPRWEAFEDHLKIATGGSPNAWNEHSIRVASAAQIAEAIVRTIWEWVNEAPKIKD